MEKHLAVVKKQLSKNASKLIKSVNHGLTKHFVLIVLT
jgi:hypothetical protein